MAAAPAAAYIAVLPPKIEGFADEVTTRDRALSAINQTLGARARVLTDVPSSCAAACLAARAAKDGAIEELLLLSLTQRPDRGADVLLVAYAADGSTAFQTKGILPPADPGGELIALLTRTFNPGAFSGTIELVGVPPSAAVLIDGMPVDGPGPWTVSATTSHQAAVVDKDGTRVVSFTVPFRGAAREVVGGTGAPRWPTFLAGGAAIAGALVAVSAVVAMALPPNVDEADEFKRKYIVGPCQEKDFIRLNLIEPGVDQADHTYESCSLLAAADPLGRRWGSGYGQSAGNKTTAGARLAMTAKAVNISATNYGDDRLAPAVTFAVAGAGVAVIAGGILAASLVLDAADAPE